VLELVKALQVAVAVTAVAEVLAYLPLTLRVAYARPGHETTHWIVAKLLMWAAQTVAFVPLAWNQVVGGIEPIANPALPDGWRVAYLVGTLSAGVYFLSARGGHLWARFFAWGAFMALVVGWIVAT
jgi:hypothetical protein